MPAVGASPTRTGAPLRRSASSGLQLVATPCHGGLATIAVAVPCGVVNETGAVKPGASLLLGRLLSQGAGRFAGAEELALALESVGGVFSAGADGDVTAVVANLPAAELAEGLAAVLAMAIMPRLEPRALRLERRRLAGQFRGSAAVPSNRAGDMADKLLWPLGPEGRTAAELARTFPRIERDDLTALHQARFGAGDAALAISTPGGLGAALDLAEQAAAAWPAGSPAPAEAPELGSERLAVASLPADLAYLSLAAPAVPRGHADADALSLAAVVLGGGATSRLFVEIREKRGLCYGIGCRYAAHATGGSLRIEAGVPPDCLDEALGAIQEQVALAGRVATEEEVGKARALLLGHLAMESDRPETWARRFSRDLVQLGRLRTFQEIAAAMRAVDAAAVRRVIGRYLAPEQLRLAVAGPGVTRRQVRAAMGRWSDGATGR